MLASFLNILMGDFLKSVETNENKMIGHVSSKQDHVDFSIWIQCYSKGWLGSSNRLDDFWTVAGGIICFSELLESGKYKFIYFVAVWIIKRLEKNFDDIANNPSKVIGSNKISYYSSSF